MQLQSWGQLRNKLDGMLEYITRLPGIVICNCHGKIQTMDTGENRILPYIDGSTKEDISKWFDFVFYNKTILDPDGKRKYLWVTARTETYDHAKDRTQLLPAEMEQDFVVVLEAARKRGFEGSKILVIGSPGSGKTYSLKTLVNILPKSSMEQAAEAQEPPEEEYDPNTVAESEANEGRAIEAQTIHSSNGASEREVAYLRGETNNIEEVSNANTNS